MNKAEAIARQVEVSNMISRNLVSTASLYQEASDLQAIIDAPDVYEPIVDHKGGWLCRSDGEAVHLTGLDGVSESWAKQGCIWPTQRLAKIASLRIKITNYLGHIQCELCPDFVPDFKNTTQSKHIAVIYKSDVVESAEYATYDVAGGVTFCTHDQAIEAGNRVKHLVDELNELIGGK